MWSVIAVKSTPVEAGVVVQWAPLPLAVAASCRGARVPVLTALLIQLAAPGKEGRTPWAPAIGVGAVALLASLLLGPVGR